MTDLKTLQYPRHVHQGGTYRIVDSADACDAALDAGWVLSPGDVPRGTPDMPEATVEVLSDTLEQDTSASEAPEQESTAAQPRRRGRPKKSG